MYHLKVSLGPNTRTRLVWLFFSCEIPNQAGLFKVEIRLALVLTDYWAPKAKDKMTLPITLLTPNPWCCIKGAILEDLNWSRKLIMNALSITCTSTCKGRTLVDGFAAEFNYPSVLFVVVVVLQWIPPANNPFDLFLQVWCSQIGFVWSLYYNIILTDFLFQVSLEAHFNTNKLSGFFSSSCFFEVASLVRISKRYSYKWWWQVWMDYIDFFFQDLCYFWQPT